MANIGKRKADHIALCATGDVGFRGVGTMLGDVKLIHDALPDMHADDVDTRVRAFGKELRAPIIIASMTGGTDEATLINRGLAKIAQERGYGFGLGSQRAMLVRPETRPTFMVRDVLPTGVLLGNLGLVQARTMTTKDIQALVDDVQADALCIHLNPAMELVQPEGDRDFRDGVDTIARLVKELTVPVIVKETGCGISPSVGARVVAVGAEYIDVSGAGGTSWVGVETKRAEEMGDTRSRTLGEAFWDWGVPTAVSVATLARAAKGAKIIATGGMSTGLDAARAIALGAHMVGIARPALKAFHSGGRDGAIAFFEAFEAELKAAMLLTGSRTVADLRRARKVVTGELRLWIDDLTGVEA
ncbi:type 2 isopentenyl-diphosphate Delta-isomerase [soil metagenome]